MSDFEYLSYAQHFGLPTKLLDWSKNPFVALYFSISSESDNKDVYVYIYYMDDLSSGARSVIDSDLIESNIDPLTISNDIIRFIRPIIDLSMSMQESVFTIQSDPFLPIEDVVPSSDLQILTINGKQKKTIREKLSRLGINQHKLFPGLEGLCKNLRWVWESYNYSQ